jgi:type II secretory pathway pseudopilin PulG
MTRHSQSGSPDDGLTLIELIIYMLISSMILVAVGGMLINSWRAQDNVISESQATNRGQIVTSAIERAVRNALALKVVGSTLQVHTSLEGRTCQGFGLAADATMAMGTDALPAVWPEWVSGISSIPGMPVLEEVVAGKTVNYAFQITTTTSAAPVRFIGSVSARNPTGASSPCWP